MYCVRRSCVRAQYLAASRPPAERTKSPHRPPAALATPVGPDHAGLSCGPAFPLVEPEEKRPRLGLPGDIQEVAAVRAGQGSPEGRDLAMVARGTAVTDPRAGISGSIGCRRR